MRTVTVVLPAYNEGPALPGNLRAIAACAAGAAPEVEVRLLVVNDGSTDGTLERLRALAAELPALSFLTLNRNFGKEAAIQCGLDHARGDAVIVMDADLQHPPELIPQMLRLWLEGVAVVEACKLTREPESVPRRLLARAFYRLFGTLSGLDLRGCSDFKLLDARVVAALRALPERARFFRGLVAWMDYPSARIPFRVPAARAGRSRWSRAGLLRYSVAAITSFSSRPLQIVTWLGLLTLLGSLALGGKALYDKFSGQALDGFTTVILSILGVGSVLMISLGLLGVYVAGIYDELKARPLYLVDPARSAPGEEASGERP